MVERLERDSSGASFGTWLRSQREHRDVSLREIADETRISFRYLQALEEDRFDVLPAPVFARGFLREYAKFVGLDPDEVITFYLSAIGKAQDSDPDKPEPVTDRVAQSPWTTVLLLVAAIVVLLGLVGLFAYLAERRDQPAMVPPPSVAPFLAEPVPIPAAAIAPEVAEAEAEVPDVAAAPLEVTVELIERCWVEVAVDGVQRISENYGAGESLRLEAERVISLTLGNPAGARVEVNGRALPLDIRPGRILRDLRIDLETVRSLSADARTPGEVAGERS